MREQNSTKLPTSEGSKRYSKEDSFAIVPYSAILQFGILQIQRRQEEEHRKRRTDITEKEKNDERQAKPGISPLAFVLYVFYCKYRNHETGEAYPSLSTIARELRIPKTTACTLRNHLIKEGWLELISDNVVRVVEGFEKSEPHSDNPNNETRTSFEKLEQYSENANDKTRTTFGKLERRSDNSNGVPPSRSRNSNDDSRNSNESFEFLESHIKNNKTIEVDQLTRPEREEPAPAPELFRSPDPESDQPNGVQQCSTAFDSVEQPFRTVQSISPEELRREEDGVKAGKIFKEIFGFPATNYQQEQFGVITDQSVWRKTLLDWKLNNYSIRSVSGMLECYTSNLIKSAKIEGRNGSTYVGQYSESAKSPSVLSLASKTQLNKSASAPRERSGIYAQILIALDQVLTSTEITTWLEPLDESRVDDGVLYLTSPSPVFREWIENNFASEVYQAIEKAGLRGLVIEVAGTENNSELKSEAA